MKILLISPLSPIGGISSWTREVLGSKYKNDFVHIDTGKKYMDNKFLFRVYDIFLIFKVIYYCYKLDYEIVHLNTSCSFFGMLREIIWISILKIKRKKIIVEYHCDVSLYCNNKTKSYFLRIISNLTNLNLVLNKQSFEKINTVTKNKVKEFPNFLNKKDIKDYVYTINPKIKKIIYLGRISNAKGCDIFANISSKMNNINFIMVGPNEENLKFKISNLNILPPIKKSDVIPFLRSADLMLFPSKSEGFPMVYLEAMNAGIPILTNNVGSAESIFGNSKYSDIVLVKDNSIDEFIKKIDILNNPIIRKNISEENYKKLIHKYSSDICIKKLMGLYEELMNKK